LTALSTRGDGEGISVQVGGAGLDGVGELLIKGSVARELLRSEAKELTVAIPVYLMVDQSVG
jgi:hypothetical protein